MKANVLTPKCRTHFLGRDHEEEVPPKGSVGMLAPLWILVWGRHSGGKDIRVRATLLLLSFSSVDTAEVPLILSMADCSTCVLGPIPTLLLKF